MKDALKKSVFLTRPVPVLGLGLTAPLFAGGPLLQNACLGLLATCLILGIAAVLAACGSRFPRNTRIAIVFLVTAGVLTCAEIVLRSISGIGNLPIWTLLPLVSITAILGAESGAYAVKGRLLNILVDGFGTGICSTLLLCGAGLIRDAAERVPAAMTHAAAPFLQQQFLSAVPVLFFLLALIMLPIERAAKRKKRSES